MSAGFRTLGTIGLVALFGGLTVVILGSTGLAGMGLLGAFAFLGWWVSRAP